eukprot:3215023-Pleurochrysis_carterae.AAC.3
MAKQRERVNTEGVAREGARVVTRHTQSPPFRLKGRIKTPPLGRGRRRVRKARDNPYVAQCDGNFETLVVHGGQGQITDRRTRLGASVDSRHKISARTRIDQVRDMRLNVPRAATVYDKTDTAPSIAQAPPMARRVPLCARRDQDSCGRRKRCGQAPAKRRRRGASGGRTQIRFCRFRLASVDSTLEQYARTRRGASSIASNTTSWRRSSSSRTRVGKQNAVDAARRRVPDATYAARSNAGWNPISTHVLRVMRCRAWVCLACETR